MNYLQIPGEPDCIIWQDELGNSGVIRIGDPMWDTYQEWLLAGNALGSMSPLDARSLDQLRAFAIAAINATADAALEPITSQYPRTEIDSWPEQCLEARAWLTDPNSSTPLLDAIAGNLRPEQKKVFCLIILGKAETYKVAVGSVIAWRRVCTLWVENQTDRERLMSFSPQYAEVPDAS